MLQQRIDQSITKDIVIISGGATGIDTIAEEIAKSKGLKPMIINPEVQQWEDKDCLMGFKTRNLKIAQECDVIYCLPSQLRTKDEPDCYHCNQPHRKSGGCYTLRKAEKMGKEVHLVEPIER